MSDHPKERQIPSALIAVGLAMYAIAAIAFAGPRGVPPTLLAVSIGAAVQTALLIAAALIVGSLLSVGFGTMRSAALKFAAVSLVSGGISALVPGGWIIALFVFLGLVVWLFEIEMTYAVVLTVVYFLVTWLVGIILRTAFA